MSDDQNIDAGSETSGEQPVAEPSQEAPVASDPTVVEPAPAEETPADAPAEEQPAPEPAADAGGAADVVPDANESRTGVAEKGLRPGDPCKCPDGRKGAVHSFD